MDVGAPRTFVGPDAFPYVDLRVAAGPGTTSVAGETEWCTDNGHGAVVHDREGGTVWVYRYGVLWSLRSFGRVDVSPEGDDHQPVVLDDPEQVLVAQPTEQVLPPWARSVLRHHLRAAGVVAPEVALVDRPTGARGLALSLPADPDAAHRLTWALPPHLFLVDLAAVGGGQPL